MCLMIKDKYIDPFTDFGFKRIFGTEENKHFLISFLNDLLDIEHPIVDITYRNLEQLGLNVFDRRAVYDVYCTDQKNNSFVVELQRAEQRYFKDRSLFYTTFPIQEQSKRGDWDYQLKQVFFVGILNFSIDSGEQYLKKVQLKDEHNTVFYDKLTYYYIQMPNFKKSEQELSNHLDYWLFYLSNLGEIVTIPPTLAQDAIIKQAFDVAEFLALSKDEQFAYQHDLKTRLDYQNTLSFAIEKATEEGQKLGEEIGKEKGERKGIEKGIKEGRKEGIKEGRKEGREEGKKQAQIRIAKKLIGILKPKEIAEKTGLSESEVLTLTKQP